MVSLFITDFGIDTKSAVNRSLFRTRGIARVSEGSDVGKGDSDARRTERERPMMGDSDDIRVSSEIDVETRISESKSRDLILNGGRSEYAVAKSVKEREVEDSGEIEVRISELGFGGGDGKSDGGHDEGECLMSMSEEIRVSSDISGGEVKGNMEFREPEIEVHNLRFNSINDGKNEEIRDSSKVGSGGTGRKFEGRISQLKDCGPYINSISSKADGRKMKGTMEAAEEQIFGGLSSLIPYTVVLGAAEGLTYGFEPGDMVWGKVASHPWWPGHIFDEAFASSSVRQTRQDGYVLVAFFGDSSYGWFEPAELIPFELHYAEKSRQTNSRNFVKAIEEAVDEVRRRSTLGLACRCRNPFNFSPAGVEGYCTVDVDNYEPGGVYSKKQIEKARNGFQPIEALSFVQQLALMPRSNEPRSFDWIKNLASVIAYRKAVFEEFDETYAQAFGVEPIRPSRNAMWVLEQPDRVPPRAPLSGPLVIAESTGGGKSSSKSVRAKDLSKKDKHLFKRRDESNEQRRAAVKLADGYVLQKRAVVREVIRREADSAAAKTVVTDVGSIGGKESLPTAAAVGSLVHGTVLAVEEMDARPEMSGRRMLDGTARPTKMCAGFSAMLENSESSGIISGVGDHHQQDRMMEDMQLPSVSSRLDGPISQKRPREDDAGEKKKKKKKDSNLEIHVDDRKRNPKIVKDGEALRKAAGKSIGLVTEHRQMKLQKRDHVDSGVLSLSPAVSTPELGIRSMKLEFPQLVDDLFALAVDPSHGIERNTLAITTHFFLNFRSLVYEKSLILQPETEPGTSQLSGESSVLESDSGIGKIKPLKHTSRQDDPTKVGRKRSPSDRQEEMSAKRRKKLNEIKSLAVEKKVQTAAPDEQKVEQKETTVVAPAKVIKPKPPVRAATPTSLVMKFTPQSSLPSIPQLKARFARFGPLEHDATRVYWKSWTCKVVFKYNSDAQAAYNHAIQNKALFGQMKVNYRLRELDLPALEVPETIKRQVEGSSDNPKQFRMGRNGFVGEPISRMHQQWQPTVQLKSCLKKASGDEVMIGGPSKETQRVKFLLGDEENNSRSEPLMIVTENNGSNADRLSSSSLALDFNNSKMHKTVELPPPPPLPTNLPLPDHKVGHFNKPLQSHHHHKLHFNEAERRNEGVNISHQMLSLLMRCNDSVNDVKRLLGYIPYHPL
ncbi:PWWP domain-containing protein 1-like isoform X2 [Magnolia sinica]|uniref:PWWP domain-containing protein 1-like isoform X2 n=1 Tax=Magnolia sinica TaxID=86752 RepID=UPI0026594886|nr:PWWP domain-containing protein 1-like isoform X2 [Magnolia sinica]